MNPDQDLLIFALGLLIFALAAFMVGWCACAVSTLTRIIKVCDEIAAKPPAATLLTEEYTQP